MDTFLIFCENKVPNFHLVFSKDNERYPKLMREFFDSPIQYDPNGTRKYFS